MTKKIAEKQTEPEVAIIEYSKTPIEIGGQTYYACYDMDALSDAEEFFNLQGANVNLLRALSGLAVKNLRTVFPCAIHTHHPELSFKEAQKLLTIPAMFSVAEQMVAIWEPALPAVATPVEG